MSGYDYGPLRTYEITWRSGHIETVQGHQVLFDSHKLETASGILGALGVTTQAPAQSLPPRFTIHGEFDGHWRLVLAAPEADLLSIRDVTDSKAVSADGAS